MKYTYYLVITITSLCMIKPLSAQKPLIKWSKNYLYNGESLFFDVVPTKDKGFLIAGADSSRYNHYFQKTSFGTPTVIKINGVGDVEWKKSFFYLPYSNYSDASAITSVKETKDGGCIVAGFLRTEFPSYDTSTFFIAKLSPNGIQEWQKRLGGTYHDRANSVIETDDNNYLIVGSTSSTNGDIIGYHGLPGYYQPEDIWVVKLNSNGEIIWKKCFGGTASDKGECIVETSDHGFIIAGASASSDGDLDLIGNKGQKDGWMFKIDGSGTILWQTKLGGSQDDYLSDIVASQDGAFILTGYTNSNDGDISGNHGSNDIWMVKISGNGTLIWSKCIGGSNDDYGANIERTLNGNILIGGSTYSNDGDITGQSGSSDMWIVMLSIDGNLIWEKTYGTNFSEFLGNVAFVSENDYIAVGWQNPTGSDAYADAIILRLGNASTIKGSTFLDANLNGIKDLNEKAFDKLKINISKNGQTRSVIPFNGKFSVNIDTGRYTSTAEFNNPYYTAIPAGRTSNLTSYFQTDSFSFAIQPVPGIKDLAINLVPLTVARPGFHVQYKIVYNNAGSSIIPTGNVKLVKSSGLTLITTSPAYSSVNNDTLTWNFVNLSPMDTASIIIDAFVKSPPAINNGDTLKFKATIYPIEGDRTPSDDTSRLYQVVVGSYDPNDKTESHGGGITQEEISLGGYLNYTIRFQNTGTDTAFNIRVKDTLRSTLDWNSFEMVSASHSYNLRIDQQNKLEWFFEDIRLVDSFRNEPLSHGYISYKVRPLNTLNPSDVIENSAGIYFDYNLPVQTNTTTTVVAQLIPLPVTLTVFSARLQREGYVLIDWKTSFEANSNFYEIERSEDGVSFKKIGQVASQNDANGSTYSFNDNTPIQGANYYRLKSVDKDGKSAYSPVQLVNIGHGNGILASLYPNPANGKFTLELTGKIKGHISLAITDLSGHRVWQKDLGSQSNDKLILALEGSHFAAGTYFITFYIDGGKITKQLIIR